MTPAEQLLLIVQQLSVEQQQAVVHFAEALRSTSKKQPVINQPLVVDIEQRLDSQRVQREMWGDEEM